jgi:hypothetical protein
MKVVYSLTPNLPLRTSIDVSHSLNWKTSRPTHRASPLQYFHHFYDALNERGVDMHKVKYRKAEAALWGIEHLNKAKKKKTSAIQAGKDAVKKAGEKTASVLNPNEDDRLHKWKREVLYGKGGPG